MLRPRALVVLLGLALGGAACGIKGPPRPPESTRPAAGETPPPTDVSRGPLSPSAPPSDAGTP
ncbi:hypothetical protein JQX13_25685 [Archangium violaceum]|uniref:hypothetical protein n=1 Tax=Archangium violaceum TaxID=83451 RepID=UPI00193B1E9D|nr:hypothetical protein [Archangium violaceum]QRK13117.1 hypothetical protein JQX13_25685 [Archangium violaceum]